MRDVQKVLDRAQGRAFDSDKTDIDQTPSGLIRFGNVEQRARGNAQTGPDMTIAGLCGQLAPGRSDQGLPVLQRHTDRFAQKQRVAGPMVQLADQGHRIPFVADGVGHAKASSACRRKPSSPRDTSLRAAGDAVASART